MCEARYQRPNSKNAEFINMQHSPFPVSLPTSKTKWRHESPNYSPCPAHLTSLHLTLLRCGKKHNKQQHILSETHKWMNIHIYLPPSLTPHPQQVC